MRTLSREDMVAEFHRAFGHQVGGEVDEDLLGLRWKLIAEEYAELREEMAAAVADVLQTGTVKKKTKERLLKEMADLQYVLSGLAVVLDIPLGVAFNRVHKSNMSKLGENGHPVIREDGKILKGPNYAPPDMEDLVKEDKPEQKTLPGFEYYDEL